MFIKCGKPNDCYACIIKKCAVQLQYQMRDRRVTFVKHLEVRFALKEMKEKQLVCFLKDLSKSFFYKCGKREIFNMKYDF